MLYIFLTFCMLVAQVISLIWVAHIYTVHDDGNQYNCTVKAFYIISNVIQFVFVMFVTVNLVSILKDYLKYRKSRTSTMKFMLYCNINLIANLIMNILNIYYYNYTVYQSKAEYLYATQIIITFCTLILPLIFVCIYYSVIVEIRQAIIRKQNKKQMKQQKHQHTKKRDFLLNTERLSKPKQPETKTETKTNTIPLSNVMTEDTEEFKKKLRSLSLTRVSQV